MPLAHPTAARATTNFGRPALAVTFALAHPGEPVDEFQRRIAGRGEWGQSLVGRNKVELVLTEESIAALLKTLGDDRSR